MYRDISSQLTGELNKIDCLIIMAPVKGWAILGSM